LSIRSNLSHNPPSGASALLSRQQFSQIAARWRSMTPSQQSVWNYNASTFPSVDAFGNPQILTGYQTFIVCNRALLLMGRPLTITSVPFNPPAYSDLVVGDINLTVGALPVVLGASFPSTVYLQFWTSKPYASLIPLLSFKSVYATVITEWVGGAIDIFAPFPAVWKPQPVAGNNVMVTVFPVNSITGHTGSPTYHRLDIS